MTWAEFLIRMFAHDRMEEKKKYLIRDLAWVTYIAPNQNPKKMKKSIDSFWPMGKKKTSSPTKSQIERLKQAQAKFIEEQKIKENG